jgi:TldD protein
MTDIEVASRQLAEVIKRYSADYIEARLEESQKSYITYRGKELESIGQATAIGGNVRALVRGGWGFVSFNNLDRLRDKVELAVKEATLVGREESKLAPVKAIVDTVSTAHNPTIKPLAEKKQLLDEYNDIIWRTPKLQTSVVAYGDSHKKVIFLSSAGSYIAQERADINLRLSAVAAGDGEVQQATLSVGSAGDFKAISGLHR